MFIKIKDTATNFDRPAYTITEEDRCAIINVGAIEAITFLKGCNDKIKIHLQSGKEFKADSGYLDEIIPFKDRSNFRDE